MSLPDYVAAAMVGLATHEDFKTVWKYFEKQADMMVYEILSSSTDPVSREVLVRLHEMYRREVVDLPDRAVKSLNKDAGQAKAPVKE